MMPRCPSPLIIAGWSARAAAQSAWRGGFDITAIDVFQDADLLRAASDGRRVPSLRGIAAAAADLPPSAWLYTGGIENQLSIVTSMAKRHQLLGCDVAVLRRVRNPRLLQRVLADGPAPMPEICWSAPTGDGGRPWLVKRRSSGGGIRVMPDDGRRPLPRGAYRQRFVSGVPYGASYLAAGDRCLFLGLCRQTHAAVDPTRPFLYGGSIGPVTMGTATKTKLMHLGEGLVAEFRLQGLFGVDVLLLEDGSLRTLEVNPRYTASMELLERVDGRSLIELHAQACLEERLPVSPSDSERVHGKRIVYVDDSMPSIVSAPAAAAMLDAAGAAEFPALADIPTPLTRLRRGEPLCTVFADGDSEHEVERGLDRQVQRLHDLLQRHGTGDSASLRSPLRRRRAASSGS